MFFLIFLYFLDKQVEGEPKSPVATASVDPFPLEMPRQEVAKLVTESTVVALGILGCHTSLVMSICCTRVLSLSCRVLCLDCVLQIESG